MLLHILQVIGHENSLKIYCVIPNSSGTYIHLFRYIYKKWVHKWIDPNPSTTQISEAKLSLNITTPVRLGNQIIMRTHLGWHDFNAFTSVLWWERKKELANIHTDTHTHTHTHTRFYSWEDFEWITRLGPQISF